MAAAKIYTVLFMTYSFSVFVFCTLPWNFSCNVWKTIKKAGTTNRILNVSPGSIKGTSFNQGATDLNVTAPLAEEIIKNMEEKNDLFIPQYEEVFKNVLERYHADFRKEGLHSYDYKVASGRVK